MVLQPIFALSACGMWAVAAQSFPAIVPSSSLFHPPDTRSAGSWSSIEYTPSSGHATVPTWSPRPDNSETWSPAIWSPPSSYAPSSPSPYIPPASTPTWPTTWPTPNQPSHSNSWSSVSYPPHGWSSVAPSWPSWPSTSAWPAPSPSLPSLNDALIAAGAAQFAALIQSDPVVAAAYAGNVPTVFAPTDQYIGNSFNVSGLRKRATLTPAQQQALLLSASEDQSEINGLRTPPGSVVPTKDTKANLKGATQKVVSDPRNKTKTANSKRWLSSILPRQDNSTSVTPLVNIFSGLGNAVGILTADIPFAGGFIHTTDGLFTVPLVLSSTAQSTGQTTFVSLTNATNQTAVLDSTPLITVFVPTNDAFAAANISPASSGIASLIGGHVVQDFAGYLPTLTNGSSFVTQSGTTVTVTIQGEDYFVNDAKIVSSNLILDNGVAHVIDSVLSPPIATYTGTGSSFQDIGVAKLLVPLLGVMISLAWSW